MLNFLISLVIGMVPEVLFFTLFISYCKDIKDKRFKLFLLLSLGYVLLIMIVRYQVMFYILYVIYSYLVIKFLYKSHISDIFMISCGFMYVAIISFICYKMIPNYWLAIMINRFVLITPLFFKNKLKFVFLKYLALWNRNDKQKIKSITLRNASLLFTNILIVVINIFLLVCMTDSLNH